MSDSFEQLQRADGYLDRPVMFGDELLDLVVSRDDWDGGSDQVLDVSRIIIPTSFDKPYFKDPNGTPEKYDLPDPPYIIKADVTPAEVVKLIQQTKRQSDSQS
jgi:hypothetical protein